MSGVVLKGALVKFTPTSLPVPVPNVIIFQYNPETMTHTWTQPEPAPPSATATGAAEGSNPLAVKGMPGETFSFTIAMDANDEIADGSPPTAALAQKTGIYSRLAALEMLLYPASVGQSGLRARCPRPSRPPSAARPPALRPPSRSRSCPSPSSSGDPGASCPSG